MPRSKKKFIDKKNAIRFSVVFRSQKDPLVIDESAPQRVLLENSQKKKADGKDPEQRKEEQKKFGVFFEDNYNYLQHLKESRDLTGYLEPVESFYIPKADEAKSKSGTKVQIKLPASVFPTTLEEKVGLLNKAAPHSGPQLDLDPEIVATFDEDYNYDDPNNELEDDFFQLAQGLPENEENRERICSGPIRKYLSSVREEDEDEEGQEDEEDSEYEDVSSDAGSSGSHEHTFAEEETKSRFTNYSLTSSVLKRNDQLTLLDDKFEEMFAQYDDSEIGALDQDDVEGPLDRDSTRLQEMAKEFCQSRQKQKLEEPSKEQKDLVRKLVRQSEGQKEEMVEVELEPSKESRWDCQSMISTYSNIYNLPTVISVPPKKPGAIKVSKSSGIPVDILGQSKLTARNLRNLGQNEMPKSEEDGRSMLSVLSQLSIRPKGETPEMKRDRKKHLREYRKERRMEKKANTMAFKAEKTLQEKVQANTDVQGMKLS